MLKVLSLKLNIFIKKGIVRAYPWALKARECVSWRKVGKVSMAILAYPALTFLMIFLGVESVARFMISPFSPSDKAHIWFFFIVASMPLVLPLLSAMVYWMPNFLVSRFALPLLKAGLFTLALSPFAYIFFIYSEYILGAFLAMCWLAGSGGSGGSGENGNKDEYMGGHPTINIHHPDHDLWN